MPRYLSGPGMGNGSANIRHIFACTIVMFMMLSRRKAFIVASSLGNFLGQT